MSTRMNILNLTTIDVLKAEESEFDFIFTVKTIKPPIFCPKCFCKAEGNIHRHGSRERIIRDVHFHKLGKFYLISNKTMFLSGD